MNSAPYNIYLPIFKLSANQHISIPIFEANFSTRYLIFFSGSRANHDTE